MTHSSTIQKNLQSIGFSEKEAKIYCSALTKDSFTFAEISKASGVNRSTCYLVVQELVNKGFLVQLPDVAISRFMVVDPKVIGTKLQEQVSKTQSILLDASELRLKVEEMPKIELYRGVEGVANICQIILKEKPEILRGVINPDFLRSYMGVEFMRNWIKSRLKRGIKLYSLQNDDCDEVGISQSSEEELRLVRPLPKNFNHESFLYLWNNKVAFFSKKSEGISFVITSYEFSRLLNEIFNFFWQGSENK